jgi:NADPH:quinone reductase-like Zn-dependent oxidoreductase
MPKRSAGMFVIAGASHLSRTVVGKKIVAFRSAKGWSPIAAEPIKNPFAERKPTIFLLLGEGCNMTTKTVIVTGAGSGIGKAVAHRLADDGFHVIAVGRTEAKLQETLKSYSGKGKIDVFTLDVADRKATNAFVAEIAKFEPISVLVSTTQG